MTVLDRFLLLVTGLTAIYLLWRFFTIYNETKQRHFIFYMAAFAVLLVAGLLLIAFGYELLGYELTENRELANDLTVIVAVLIPTGIAAGLVSEFFPQYEKPFLAYAVIGLVAIAGTRLTTEAGDDLAKFVLIAVHSISGVVILGIPLLMVKENKAVQGFAFVALGGLLIDAGGVALAFLKLDKQFLFFSEDFTFDILALLLLLMTLAFTWGFTKHLLSEHPEQPVT